MAKPSTGQSSAIPPCISSFEGTYWQNPTGITAPDVIQQVLNITNSSYLSGTQQYGSNGRAYLSADWKFDTSMAAFPHYLDSGLSFYDVDLQAIATQYMNPAEALTPVTARGVYFVVTPPNSWGLNALEDGGYHTDGVIAPFGRLVSVPDGWLGLKGFTKAQQAVYVGDADFLTVTSLSFVVTIV